MLPQGSSLTLYNADRCSMSYCTAFQVSVAVLCMLSQLRLAIPHCCKPRHATSFALIGTSGKVSATDAGGCKASAHLWGTWMLLRWTHAFTEQLRPFRSDKFCFATVLKRWPQPATTPCSKGVFCFVKRLLQAYECNMIKNTLAPRLDIACKRHVRLSIHASTR